MTDRVRSASTSGYRGPKMETELLSPRKTMLVLVIVVGCFAVLWPKVFYPMLVGSATQHIKPSPIDKTTGCCDVISEIDVNTIKLMSELCGTVIKPPEGKPLTGKEMVQRCRQEVLQTCGIDISAVLQEQVRLGQNVKQILDQVRSLNGSLCLKYNYGVAPWRLGVPHRITVKMASDPPNIRQERPLHLRSELIHPAFRERGRAIPQPQAAPPVRPPPRVVEGRPGPLPGMRPTLGGAGHVVPPSKQGTSSMSVIMPIYTIGIVIFFTYTLLRIIFKKQPEGVGGSLYPPVEPDPHFRKEVFDSEASRLGPRLTRENISSKLVVNAMSALLDEVDQEIEARRKSSEVASQDLVNGTLSNGDVLKPQETEEQPTVKVLGMEMTASCEGGKKWSRPDSPVLPTSPPPPPAEPVTPPQEIYLEGALPAQSHLLVADSATEAQPTSGEDPAVVLAGKMTLSVISLDGENGTEEAANQPAVQEEPIPVIELGIEEPFPECKRFEDPLQMEEPEFEIEEYVLEPLIVERFEAPQFSRVEVEDIEKKLQESTQTAVLTEGKVENVIQPPLIHLESEDVPHTVEVDVLEQEVDSLIQEAIENIQKREPLSLEILHNLNLPTNEIDDQQIEVAETSDGKPTLQVVPEVEKTKLVVEESTPTTDTIIAKEEPILTNNRIEDLIKEEKSDSNSIEKIEENEETINPTKATEEKTSSKLVGITQVEEIKEIDSSSLVAEKTTIDVAESKSGPIVEEVSKPIEISDKAAKTNETAEILERTCEGLEEIKEIEKTNITAIETPKPVDEPQQCEEKLVQISTFEQARTDEPKTSRLLVDDTQNSEEKPVQISETIEMPKSSGQLAEVPPTSQEKSVEAPKPSSPTVEESQKVEDPIETPKPSSSTVEESQIIEEKPVETPKSSSPSEKVSPTCEEKSPEAPIPSSPTVEESQKVEEKSIEAPISSSLLSDVSSTSEEKHIEAPKSSSPLAEVSPTKFQEKPVELLKPSSPRVEESQEIEEKHIEAPKSSSLLAEGSPTSEEKPVEIPSSNSYRVEESQKIEEKPIEAPKSSSPLAEVSTTSEEKPIEAPKPSSPTIEESQKIGERPLEKKIADVEVPKSSSPVAEEKPELIVLTDDDELGSEEELVEEIEEILYESHEEESDEEESEEVAIITNRTDSGAVERVNGERSEDLVEESKYTTVSGATAAENDISDEELTDNEDVEDEEIIEVEEEIEDDDYIIDEGNDVNHVSGESDVEL